MAQRSFQVGQARFAVRTTSGEFCRWLDRTLEAYAIDDDAPVHYSVVVDGGEGERRPGGRGFHILYRGTVAVARTLRLPTVARALLSELDALTFHEREDAIYLRGGLIRSNGTTVLAPHGMVQALGKLGGRVERSGFSLGATRFTAVDPGSGTLVPTPSTLRVPADALHDLPDRRPAAGGADRFFVDEPVGADVLLALTLDRVPFAPVSRAVALGRLSASAVNLPRLGGRALTGLAGLVGSARCYALGFVAGRGMLDALAALLREGDEGAREDRDESYESARGWSYHGA